jgi:hypothetical protein
VIYHIEQYIGFFRAANLGVQPKGPHLLEKNTYTIQSKFMIGVTNIWSSHYHSMMFLGMITMNGVGHAVASISM